MLILPLFRLSTSRRPIEGGGDPEVNREAIEVPVVTTTDSIGADRERPRGRSKDCQELWRGWQ